MRRGTAFVTLLLLAALAPREAAAGPALVIELSNNKVLYAEDADSPWYPASLTKIMTAYLVFEALKAGKLDLNTRIPCSAAANAQPPSKIGVAVGNELTVNVALNALIIKSANDAAVMLAEAVAGSEAAFVAQMNATAKRLGMERTVFVNPNGLPAPNQVTTARDLAKLARAVLKDFPEYEYLWAKPEMRLGKSRMVTHNGLLRSFEGADGMKTGFTCDSGFNVVATASRDGRRIIAVVLGDHSSGERNVRAASLLEYGFQQHGWKQLFSSTTLDNMPLATAAAVKSVRNDVTSWGCNERKVRAAKAGAKKRTAKASKKKKPGTEEAAKAAPITVEVAPEGGDGTPATVQLRGTTPPPAAASFQQQ
ncbi:MAG: D-alanyl-D-alanine carboxypeptidase [Hyphomicrobium sp.]|uniref:D-alanyl-D-alanine carboxypeptidase family protein n=1 Tax=Hyphomicrobium sp. TaxID=82 RepID=UPI001327BDD9|nr:D-alanyl-D-alanine carboxypeptidase family protein [Hyphomicrobium sp.]KAB2940368.1 MAG: D-alanyl-D-alanine carboxypeptidase [Hyphomicrobium sp.]MBZ0209141.1 D-alanyl-D-alanine carboxypeptidase [Hyphomicrobium sp.]MCZ7595744.1 D-alanyl-D-alanine carboxypeptidase [Hyphomicrobium sp.]